MRLNILGLLSGGIALGNECLNLWWLYCLLICVRRPVRRAGLARLGDRNLALALRFHGGIGKNHLHALNRGNLHKLTLEFVSAVNEQRPISEAV